MTTDLMPRDTVEEIVRLRDEALKLYTEASEKIGEANKLLARATLTSNSYRFSVDRHTLARIGEHQFIEATRKKIDQYVWRHIFNTSSLGDLFNSKTRREFEKKLEEDPPEVTVDTVVATAMNLAGNAGDMFTQSVHDLYTLLRRRFKSHSGFGFGSRLIFEGMMSWGYIGTHCEQCIWDLERVVYILDGKSPPERYGGILGMTREYRRNNGQHDTGEVENEYFKCRWYKNGNLHVWLLREDITAKMNATLENSNQLGAGAA